MTGSNTQNSPDTLRKTVEHKTSRAYVLHAAAMCTCTAPPSDERPHHYTLPADLSFAGSSAAAIAGKSSVMPKNENTIDVNVLSITAVMMTQNAFGHRTTHNRQHTVQTLSHSHCASLKRLNSSPYVDASCIAVQAHFPRAEQEA